MDYKKAGVDLSSLNKVKKRMGRAVASTFNENVVTDYGHFGGGFRLTGYKKPVLVSSTDNIGTKSKVAQRVGIYNTIGADLVNHSSNDILCTGATPLFLLDYLAFTKLDAEIIAQIVEGFAKACRKENIVLIGGETAQLPGVHKPGDFDLSAAVVGVVEYGKLIDGSAIKPGDVAIGLRSTGLHTNGYSLARKVLIDGKGAPGINAVVPGTKKTIGQTLLAVHKSYRREVEVTKPMLKGIAHITGGGFGDNIARLLPGNVDCVIQKKSWKPFPIFKLIQQHAGIGDDEAYRVFNMGVGMVLFCSPKNTEEVRTKTRGIIIGHVEKGKGEVHLV